MKRVMFEHTKMILSKVSLNPNLFYKELQEGIDKLFPYEVKELEVWLEAYTKNKPEILKSRVLMDKWYRLRLSANR